MACDSLCNQLGVSAGAVDKIVEVNIRGAEMSYSLPNCANDSTDATIRD